MSYDLIELTLSRLGEQLPERLSPCLESHQTDRRSDEIRSGISRQSANTSRDASATVAQSAPRNSVFFPLVFSLRSSRAASKLVCRSDD